MKKNTKQKRTGNIDRGIAWIGISIAIAILLSASIGVVNATTSSGWESEADLVSVGDDRWPIKYYAYPHIAYNLKDDGKWVLISNRHLNGAYSGYYYDGNENKWVQDNTLVSGLTSHCWQEYPAFAYNVTGDGKWTLISHCTNAFYGYYWDGVQWIEDSSRVNGLSNDIGRRTSHTFIEDLTGDGRWTLLSGTEGGFGAGGFRGFCWDGTKWLEDSSRANGLPYTGGDTRVTAGFNVFGENKWNVIITHRQAKTFRVFEWDGTQWIEDTTKAAGLTTDLSELVPTLGYNVTGNGKWVLISGVAQLNTLVGFYYNSVDTSSLQSQTDVSSYHTLATTVQINFSYPNTWNHRVRYSTNPDMSGALWSDWSEDMVEVGVKLTRLNPGTTYYYEAYTYVPWDSSYYVKSSVNSFTTASASDYIVVNPGESIQDAIEMLPLEGGTVELATGVHDVYDTIVIHMSNITIQGTHSSEIRSHNPDKDIFVIPYENPNAAEEWENMPVLENFTFKGFKTNSTYEYVGDNNFIHAWKVKNFIVEDIYDSSHALWLVALNPSGIPILEARNENIYIRNNTMEYCGFSVADADNVFIINNTILGSQANWAIYADHGLKHIQIIGNRVINAGMNAGLIVDVGEDWLVRDNYFQGSRGGIDISQSPDYAIIENNTITGAWEFGIMIKPQSSIGDVTIKNNRIYNNGIGIWTTNYHGASGVYPANITNNVIYDNSDDGIKMTSEHVGLDIMNNIITNNGGYGINYEKGEISHSYNDVWGNTLGSYSGTSAGTGDISIEPMFTDQTNGDFHLRSTIGRWTGSGWVTDSEYSPCIDAGEPSSNYTKEPNYPIGHINMGAYGNTEEASMGVSTGPTPPIITAHLPMGTNVPIGTTISVTFSEAMNKSSTENVFSISPSVTGSFNWNGNQIGFTPDAIFDYATTYTVTIGTGAQDLAGNNLAGEYSWQFTTITTGVWSSGWESEADLVRIGDDDKWSIYCYAYPHIAYNLRDDGKWVLISNREVNDAYFGYYYDDSANKWVEDSSLVSGLVSRGWREYPAFAYNVTGDGKWTLISHYFDAFYGYYWDGTKWIEDSSRINGLPTDIGLKTSHTFIEDLIGDGRRTLLSGTADGTFRAFYWNGTKWVEDSSRVNGLPDIGGDSRVTSGFNVFGENKWNLITTTRTSKSFRVFCWDGTQWIEDTTKAAGLTTDLSELVPTLGYNVTGNGKWVLISGVGQTYTLLGVQYNSVDTSSLPLQTDISSYHSLATTARIKFSYPYTWNHRVKYSTNADMSNSLWSDWFEDMDEVDVKLTRLNPGTAYYYEVYTYVPWDTSYYVKSSVNSFSTLPAQNPVVVNLGESIQDAIETLPLEGGTVELAEGVHEVYDTIVIYMSNITIQGTHSSEIRSCDSDKSVFIIPHEHPSSEEDWENMPTLENFLFKGFKVTSNYNSDGEMLVLAWNVKNITVEDILDNSYLTFLIAINPSGGSTSAHSEDIYIRNNNLSRSTIIFCFSKNVHVLNNTLLTIDARMDAIDINRNNEYVYVYDNYVNGGTNYAIRGHGGDYVYIYNNTLFSTQVGIFNDGLSNTIISNNTITDCSYAAFEIEQDWGEPNITIKNNRIYNNPCHGIWTSSDDGPQPKITQVNITNNVIYNNGGDGIRMTDAWVQLDISNNIITNNGGHGINYIETIEPTTISYNTVWQNALGNYNNTSPGVGDIEADPKFASTTPGEEDFHLKSTAGRRTESGWVTDTEHSPCIDAGDTSSEYSNEPDYPSGHINIGAHGNRVEASRGTPAGPDTIPPYTSGHSPAKSATGIPRDTNIVVHIKDDGEGVNQSSIVMTVEGETVSPTITGNKNDYTSTYTPSVPFDYEQVVDITIEAQDLASNDMFLESYSFTIEQATGPTPPTITTHAPTGTDVSVATTLSVTFSEAMNETSVENAFSISPSVTGAFSWAGNTMTFTPGTNLDDETTYTVTLGTGAQDLAGNNIETEYNWQFSTVQPGEGLVGWWKLDEDKGDIAHDASGKGNDGTLYGNPIWTTGKINGALDFNGVDDYVRCGGDASLTPEYITVSAWIKPATDGTSYNIVRRGAHSNYNYEYGFGLGSDGKLEFSVGNGTARFSARSSALSWDSTGTTWYHVAATYDGSTTNIYRDGVLVGTDTNGIGAIATESFYYLFIGRSPVTTLSSFHGIMDEVKIYNRALSTDEILADYQISTGSISGTVTAYGGIIIEEANATLATLAGDEIATTQTDYTGHYEFADVAPGYYNLNATKHGYWPDTDPVTITSDNQTTADISLCRKGDFNTNSEPADAGDLAMMVDATNAGTSDETYDLDGDGNPADEADLTLLKDVSVGVAELE